MVACTSSPKADKYRCPGSQEFSCGKVFAEKYSYAHKLQNAETGLSQATFSSVDGQVFRQGPQQPVIDKNQIVSLFSTYKGGALNRGGTMIQGTPTEVIFDKKGNPAYIIFAGQPVRLLEHTAYMNSNSTRVIKGQGYEQHPQGFSSPLGRLKGWKVGLDEVAVGELRDLLKQYTRNGITTLEFESGVVVRGEIDFFTENNSANFGTPTVLTFKSGTCKVTLGNRVLFDPSWGVYDMILGTEITDTNARADTPMYWPRN